MKRRRRNLGENEKLGADVSTYTLRLAPTRSDREWCTTAPLERRRREEARRAAEASPPRFVWIDRSIASLEAAFKIAALAPIASE